MAAILEAYQAGLLNKKHWLPNIVSGIIVGIVALPLGMAFAIASGVKPEQGLYTAIIAGFIVSVFGGSRFQIAGPTGAFIVILAGITHKYGISGLQISTVMAGVMLMLLGFTKLGSIIRFIPAPVIVGFTSGIAVIIWVGQWKDFFGFPAPTGEHFHEKLWHSLLNFPSSSLTTTGLGLTGLILLIVCPRIPYIKKIPAPLIALVIVTLIQSWFHFEEVVTIGSAFGGIPQKLPSFHIPGFSVKSCIELIGPAFTIAMLGAIESLLSAVVADDMAGTRHNSNKELIGQGLANIVTPFFGGFAATGAIARTATNIRNGGTSPLAGIVHSVTLILIIVFFAPYATDVPLAALAAILFVVAWNMSEFGRFLKMVRRAPRADIAILFITFTLTIFADLVVAVNIGVILASLQFLRRMSASVEVRQIGHQELLQEFSSLGIQKIPDDLSVFVTEGPLFFGAVENLEKALVCIEPLPKIVIIRLRWVPFMDITGLQSLEEAIQEFHRLKIQVVLTGANDRVRNKLVNAGVIALIGADNFFPEFSDALKKWAVFK